MKHATLFSGIGGPELAAEWMGWENAFHCEINPFGRRVLDYYWPKAESYENIKETDFTKWRGTVDVLTGGFPCQPYSAAGKRKGKADERHLWPEMLRAIREIRPSWVVGENVFGITNWNGGVVFEEVCAELEAEGYEVQPFVLPAAGINAPHKRDRVFFIAYSNGSANVRKSRENDGEGKEERDEVRESTESSSLRGNDSNASSVGYPGKEHRSKESRFDTEKDTGERWENFPTQSPICSRNDEFSDRLDRITFPKWRNESIAAYGNAIVPGLMYQIYQAIEEYTNL